MWEQDTALYCITNTSAQFNHILISYVLPVYEDFTFTRLIESVNHLKNRGFTTTRRTNNGYKFSLFYCKIKIWYNNVVSISFTYIFKFNYCTHKLPSCIYLNRFYLNYRNSFMMFYFLKVPFL